VRGGRVRTERHWSFYFSFNKYTLKHSFDFLEPDIGYIFSPEDRKQRNKYKGSIGLYAYKLTLYSVIAQRLVCNRITKSTKLK